ncbi:MAG: GyrI-like domain-containing protein [Candidatus Hodarchaeota archaeon]
MEKVDHKKVFKELYKPSAKMPSILDVPEMNFIMVDGRGDPNTAQEYTDAMAALYPVAYTLKFKLKKEKIADFIVMPLEGLWWIEGKETFYDTNKDEWSWTSMIMQPSEITTDAVGEAIEEVQEKRDPPSLSKLRFEAYHEGLSVQIMHIGPWAEEAPTIKRMHKFAEDQGYSLRGKHHEIYLSDPRRTAPEKLKTVIRQPIR